MFSDLSNVACNNGPFRVGTIPDMAEGMQASAARLYAAAKNMAGTEGKSALARLLNESPQVVNNWEGRGVSEGGALKAQAVIGCDAIWVLTGKGSPVLGWPFSPDLRGPVQRLDADELQRLEAVIRLHLRLPTNGAPLSIIRSDKPEIDHPPESLPARKRPSTTRKRKA